MAVVSIVLGAIGSVIVLASHAIPDAQGPTTAVAAAAEEIAGDLPYARSFVERSANVIEFTVADRSGDGVPETIRYAYSGTPGDPLTLRYNGGTIVSILEDVQEFELLYDTVVATEQVPSQIESAEIVLASQTSTTRTPYDVSEVDWIGQYFQPSLPADAIDWKVTRVLFEARRAPPADSLSSVQLREADVVNLPMTSILEQYSLPEVDLDVAAYTWHEFLFNNVTGRPPGTGLCLVLQWVAGDKSASIPQIDTGVSDGLLLTSDAGGSWSYAPRAINHYVYGTYTTPGPLLPVSRTYLTRIRIKLRTTSDPSGRIRTGVALLQPLEITP